MAILVMINFAGFGKILTDNLPMHFIDLQEI